MTLLYSEKNMWQAEYTLRFTNFKTEDTLKQFARMLLTIFEPVQNSNVNISSLTSSNMTLMNSTLI